MSKRINISSAAASRIRPNKWVDFSPIPSTPYTKKWALRSIVPTHCKIEKCIFSNLFLLPNYFSNWHFNCSNVFQSVKTSTIMLKSIQKLFWPITFLVISKINCSEQSEILKLDFWSHPQNDEQNHCHSTFYFRLECWGTVIWFNCLKVGWYQTESTF